MKVRSLVLLLFTCICVSLFITFSILIWWKYRIPPEQKLPPDYYNDFLMNGKVMYVHDYRKPKDLVGNSVNVPRERVNRCLQDAKNRIVKNYHSDPHIFQALNDSGGLWGKRIAIVSNSFDTPWYEAIAMTFQATDIVTLQNREKVNTDHGLLPSHVAKGFKPDPDLPKFDLAIVVGVFEAEGLGRQGESFDPEGDFEAMKGMKDILKPNGTLILTVPVGMDTLNWNRYRIYGKHRLKKLLKGWKTEISYGYTEELLSVQNKGEDRPVFVLKNVD